MNERIMIHSISMYACEAAAELQKLRRSPQFLVPTLLLPVGSFAMSAGLGGAGRPHALLPTMAAFSVMAALGPALFGFGSNVSTEREAGMLDLKRVSPLPPAAYLAAKLAACMAASALSIAAILLVGALHHAAPDWWRWPLIVAVGASSAIPFTLLGLTLGLGLGPQAATATSNVLLITLTALGGMLVPIASLPSWLAAAAELLPTIHLGRLLLAVLGGDGRFAGSDALAIVAFSTVFAAAALAGWHRSAA